MITIDQVVHILKQVKMVNMTPMAMKMRSSRTSFDKSILVFAA